MGDVAHFLRVMMAPILGCGLIAGKKGGKKAKKDYKKNCLNVLP